MSDSDNPMVVFLMALVTRLGRQSSLLWLGPDGQPSSQHAYVVPEPGMCQGCASCKGSDWLLKTRIVAHLWVICCEWSGRAKLSCVQAVELTAVQCQHYSPAHWEQSELHLVMLTLENEHRSLQPLPVPMPNDLCYMQASKLQPAELWQQRQ